MYTLWRGPAGTRSMSDLLRTPLNYTISQNTTRTRRTAAPTLLCSSPHPLRAPSTVPSCDEHGSASSGHEERPQNGWAGSHPLTTPSGGSQNGAQSPSDSKPHRYIERGDVITTAKARRVFGYNGVRSRHSSVQTQRQARRHWASLLAPSTESQSWFHAHSRQSSCDGLGGAKMP